ncbi:SGNH hydrolase [Annulohypoxylon bovei var. microspora]|nr:SGNH hydrolase [Annulohypoxylon bovei var. microspora]
MSVFTKCFTLALLPMALGSPLNRLRSFLAFESPTNPIDKRDNDFVWASVGDSWAAGVSYSPEQHTDYDDDKNGCHRWKDSYGPIMERDTTWTTGAQKFNFAACSGAILSNIVASSQGDNPPQMSLVGSPQMITYHAGGNNCGFGAVVSDCIFQPWGDYGPEYPDPSGQCAKQLANSNAYIDRAGDGGLYQDERNTVADLLGHAAVRDNKDFRLYILGYAHFFNLGANYCDGISFGALASVPVVGNAPKVSDRLRTDVNDGVERVNQILARVARDAGDPRVRFLDISPAFDGHRFCEDGHGYKDQWYSADVWLWNFNTPSDDPPADPSLMDTWLNGTYFPDNTVLPTYPNGTAVGVEMQGGVETDGSGGSTGPGPTWFQRPFHPKQGGTQAIADIIIAQALADKIPGVVGSSSPTTGACDCNEDGCSPGSPACCASGTC